MTSALSRIRQKKGLSLELVAQDLKINQGTYWRIENCLVTVKPPIADTVSAYFGVSTRRLFEPKRMGAIEEEEAA